MKKLATIFLLTILLVGVGACTNDTPKPDPKPDPEEEKYLNDKIAPHISYFEASKMNVSVKQNSTLDIFEGLKAVDNLEGDITDKIEVDKGNFDISVVGTYELFFFVKDRAGNVSALISKNITVLETYQLLSRYPIFTTVIAGEMQAPTVPSCFKGAYYHKVFSSKDFWMGIEAEITLPMPDINRYEQSYNDSLNIDPNSRNLDNPSIYMGGKAALESDVGLSLKNALFKDNAGNESISIGSFAFRPFWRYITSYDYDLGTYDRPNGRFYAVSCNGTGTTKNCSGNWDYQDTQYYYLPGDKVRMLVYSPKPGYLQLQIELLEVSTLPYSIGVRTFNGWKTPESFISPLIASSGQGSQKAEFKRVNAIDQVANEGKPVIPTTTTVTDAIWHNAYLYRNINDVMYRVPMNNSRVGVMNCPLLSDFTISGIDQITGGEVVSIHPGSKKD
ncbi:MAG TPA: immunoglobulin-like domain-containing protein [Acholeplasma sp.]|nr:immunoglobulin-like domain-containing protein [Acholeplasma sp.]